MYLFVPVEKWLHHTRHCSWVWDMYSTVYYFPSSYIATAEGDRMRVQFLKKQDKWKHAQRMKSSNTTSPSDNWYFVIDKVYIITLAYIIAIHGVQVNIKDIFAAVVNCVDWSWGKNRGWSMSVNRKQRVLHIYLFINRSVAHADRI